jgi:LPXTG-site transpeptidase (sortase) family protein
MRPYANPLNLFIVVIVLIAIVIFTMTFVRAGFNPATEAEMPIPAAKALSNISPTSYPKQLSIPAIEVNAHVQYVGIGKSGHMAVPTNYTDVGWYRYGPPPGASGKAVFAGHLDNGFGLSGVFNRLHEVKTGDDIYVTNGKNERLHFRVIEEERLPFNTTQTAAIFASVGRPELKLITCEGQWDAAKKMYSDRLIVTAVFLGRV